MLILNKSDAMTAREASSRKTALARASGSPVMLMSGVTQAGLPEVLRVLMNGVAEARANAPAITIEDRPIEPARPREEPEEPSTPLTA